MAPANTASRYDECKALIGNALIFVTLWCRLVDPRYLDTMNKIFKIKCSILINGETPEWERFAS